MCQVLLRRIFVCLFFSRLCLFVELSTEGTLQLPSLTELVLVHLQLSLSLDTGSLDDAAK